ncbi:MAG: hypothetical protein R3F54_24725 [Alphaproteobacteria bacterium]
MTSMVSDSEAACLDVAIDLLQRSDAYAAAEPLLSRQYARQAYEMAALSPDLRDEIVQARIEMIVRSSGQRRIADILNDVSSPSGGRRRRLKKASLIISMLLAALFLHSTSVVELPVRQVELAARLVDAPL